MRLGRVRPGQSNLVGAECFHGVERILRVAKCESGGAGAKPASAIIVLAGYYNESYAYRVMRKLKISGRF